MANHLPFRKQVVVVNMRAERPGIRSAETMTGVHRDAMMCHRVPAGTGCETRLDEMMHGLDCKRLEPEECWALVGVKQARIKPRRDPKRVGDFNIFTSIDRGPKLTPAFRVGKRDGVSAPALVLNLRRRLVTRPQLTADAAKPHGEAIEDAFGSGVDTAQLTKVYDSGVPEAAVRYAPPRAVGVRIAVFEGQPDTAYSSTSFGERSDRMLWTFMRRMTHLSNGFSRKPENFNGAVAICSAWYNPCIVHRTLRVTPAMEPGLVSGVWTVEDLVRMALKAAVEAA